MLNRPGQCGSRRSPQRASHHANGKSGADNIRATPQACADQTPIPSTDHSGMWSFIFDLLGLAFTLALLALAWHFGSMSLAQLAW